MNDNSIIKMILLSTFSIFFRIGFETWQNGDGHDILDLGIFDFELVSENLLLWILLHDEATDLRDMTKR